MRPIRWAAAAALTLCALFASSPSLQAAQGGPDAAGYQWYDINSGCDVEADSFVLANSIGFFDAVFVNNVGPFNLGFTFPWYAGTATQVWVNRSGLIFFSAPPDQSLTIPQVIPTADGVSGFIAPLWDEYFQTDLIVNALYWEQFPDYFKMSWDVQRVRDFQDVQYEVYLYPTGDVRVEYLTPGPAPWQATIGIESDDEATGLEVMGRGTPAPGVTFADPLPFAVCFNRPGELSCDAATDVSCNSTVNGDFPASLPVAVDQYGCSPATWSGNERIYRLTLTEITDLTATLTAGDRGKAVFLLNGCDEWNCLDGGTNTASAITLPPGEYYIVVDAARVADEGPFTLEISCTGLSEPIACEETLVGSTVGLPNRLDGWPCLAGDFSGPESYYTLDFPGPPGNINVSLASGTGQAAFVLDAAGGLDTRACIRGGVGGTIIYDPPAGSYLIVVDGPAGSDGDFTLSVACAPELVCAPGAGDLPCNSTVSGDTSALVNNADFYRCAPAIYDGPEAVYTFTNVADQVVSFALDAADPNMDLLILNDCNEGSCIEWSGDNLDIELPAGDYVIVVDGRNGASGPYDLSIICGNTIEPDFIQLNGAAGQCFMEDKTAWLTPDIPRADVLFAIDLTGSMGEERAQLQSNMQDIIDRLEVFISDVAFGLVSYKDYVASGSATDPCSYSATGFGSGTDYPYRLEQPITTDRIAIQDAVNNLPAASGGSDGPESYSRAMWESANDPGIGWRAGARRLMVNFGDELPHDCNVQECLGGVSPSNRGNDIGRDNMPGTADDIPVLDAIQAMVDARIALLHLDSGASFGGGRLTDPPYTYTEIWACWARLTGGIAQELNSDGTVPGGIDLPELVGNVIAEQGAFCSTLELAAEPGYEDWLASATPQYVDVSLPAVVTFTIEICVPPGTPEGQYTFEVQLLCSGGVVVTQTVVVDVVVDCLPSIVAGPTDQTICAGDTATLDGSGVGLVNCDGTVEYTWRDSGGMVVGTMPMVDVSPSADETYTLEVVCSTEPTCMTGDEATVFVDTPPVLDPAAARDLQNCNVGIEVSWPAAVFPSGAGFYNVYRSETSCADALTRAPLVQGLSGLSWVDSSTRDGRSYYYVVEAEDSEPGTSCVPAGPVVGGSVARACIDPPITETGDAMFPDGVYATLFASHVGHDVTFEWSTARGLMAGETYRLLKAVDEPTNSFSTVNGTMDVSRSYMETDPSSPLQFFDLRVANACEVLSLDEFPPTADR